MRSLNRLKVNKIYLSIFFMIIIIICLCFANSIKVNAQINESKIYTNATIDEDFDDSCVLAVLKSSFSKYNDIDSTIVNKIMQENNVLSVENISEFSEGIVNNDGTLNDRINSEIVEHLSNIEFKQVLKINLNEKSKDNVLGLIKIIEQYDEVICAEPNYYFSPEAIPDDTMISKQWSLIGDNGIDMTKSWDFAVGTRDIRVGVLDTGIINHNDLNDNLTAGYDFYHDNSTTTDDSYGHGTSVAGIIGAVGNNTQGVTGINQRVTIVPMQVSYIEKSKTYIDTLAVKEAIQYASNLWDTENRISILNYSVSGYGSTTSLLATIETFPGLFVWSAGNKGENVDNFKNISMFNLTNLISVGAHDKYNGRSIWDSTQSSSYGSAVDIYAPGGKGLGQNSDNCYTTSASSSSSYRYFNGTSCAAPHVAGVAALLLSL